MKTHLWLVLLLSPVLSSCFITHTGSVSSGPLLNVADRRVAFASGEARGVFVLGIGDISRDAMVREATNNLYKNRPLRENEYYSNITCDVTHKFIFGFLVVSCKVTVSALVLRTGSEPVAENRQADLNLQQPLASTQKSNRTAIQDYINYGYKTSFKNNVDSFALGEKVFYESRNGIVAPYIIDSIDQSRVFLKSSNSKLSSWVVQSEPLFSTKKRTGRFSAGEIVEVRLFLAYDKASIVALNNSKALFEYDEHYFVRSLNDLKKAALSQGDSLYYAFDSKNYKLYVASAPDKQTVMLLPVNPDDRNMLAPLKNMFFLKNRNADGFSTGDKVTMELRDAYNYTTYKDGLILGISDDNLFLMRSGEEFYVLPAVKLKKIK